MTNRCWPPFSMSLAVGAIVDGCPCQTLQQNKNNKARCSAVGQKVRPHSVGLSQCSSSGARLASSTCKTNPPVGKQGQFSSAVWTIGICRQHAAVMICSILVWPSSSCQELSSGNTSKAGKQSTRLTLTPPCQSILCQRFAYVDKAQACATRNLSPSCTKKLSITQYTLHKAWAMQNSSEFVLWSYDHFKTLIYFHALSMWKEGSKHGRASLQHILRQNFPFTPCFENAFIKLLPKRFSVSGTGPSTPRSLSASFRLCICTTDHNGGFTITLYLEKLWNEYNTNDI